MKTRATTEVHHFFSETPVTFGAQDRLQNLIWSKIKLLKLGMKISMA